MEKTTEITIAEEIRIGEYILEVGDTVKLPEVREDAHSQYECKDCGKIFTIVPGQRLECPNCGSADYKFLK